ncbi:MAG: amidase family protein, partial [Bacteroidota bacterium]
MKLLIPTLLLCLIVNVSCAQQGDSKISTDHIKNAERLYGLEFTEAERELMLEDIRETAADYEAMRQVSIPNSIPMALDLNVIPPGMTFDKTQYPIDWDLPENVAVPENKEDLAFYTVAQLASLIKNKQITSTELTQIYLNRLKKYGDTLQCVITITEEVALVQAKRADAELAAGRYRGVLHGIPYGIKDLLAVKGTKTTWGAMPY